ncbi:hypothetical protein BC829DRAFT_432456 [Chytridium lagenaria]|nr:hypothetical protein BC829DRAFT_432456 [Chytridium lagenaria]
MSIINTAASASNAVAAASKGLVDDSSSSSPPLITPSSSLLLLPSTASASGPASFVSIPAPNLQNMNNAAAGQDSIATHIKDLHDTLNTLIESGRRREEIWHIRRKSISGSLQHPQGTRVAAASAQAVLSPLPSAPQPLNNSRSKLDLQGFSSPKLPSVHHHHHQTASNPTSTLSSSHHRFGMRPLPLRLHPFIQHNPRNAFHHTSESFGNNRLVTHASRHAPFHPSQISIKSVQEQPANPSSTLVSRMRKKPSLDSSSSSKPSASSGILKRSHSSKSSIVTGGQTLYISKPSTDEAATSIKPSTPRIALEVEIPRSPIHVNDGILAELTTSIDAVPDSVVSQKRLSTSSVKSKAVTPSSPSKRSSIRSSTSSHSHHSSSLPRNPNSSTSLASLNQPVPTITSPQISFDTARFSLDDSPSSPESPNSSLPSVSRPSLDDLRPSLESLCPAGAEATPPLPTPRTRLHRLVANRAWAPRPSLVVYAQSFATLAPPQFPHNQGVQPRPPLINQSPYQPSPPTLPQLNHHSLPLSAQLLHGLENQTPSQKAP